MNISSCKITIKQATEADIPVLEGILLDTVNWLDEIGQSLWYPEDMVAHGTSNYLLYRGRQKRFAYY